jgi:hypothetical protein
MSFEKVNVNGKKAVFRLSSCWAVLIPKNSKSDVPIDKGMKERDTEIQ